MYANDIVHILFIFRLLKILSFRYFALISLSRERTRVDAITISFTVACLLVLSHKNTMPDHLGSDQRRVKDNDEEEKPIQGKNYASHCRFDAVKQHFVVAGLTPSVLVMLSHSE